jgi:hypothetical protein
MLELCAGLKRQREREREKKNARNGKAQGEEDSKLLIA